MVYFSFIKLDLSTKYWKLQGWKIVMGHRHQQTGPRIHFKLNSHLILFFVLKKNRLIELVFNGTSYTCPFLHKLQYLFCRAYLAANFKKSLPRKVGLYAHHQYGIIFPSHQQATDLNNQRQLQLSPNEVSFFD